MKRKPSKRSGIFTLRVVLVCVLLSLSAMATFVAFAASPASGTIAPTTTTTVAWNGTPSGVPPTAGGESSCVEGTNCDTFKLTISGTPADWAAAAKQVHIEINWSLNSTDYDLFIHKGSLSGPLVGSSASGGTTQEQVDLNPASASIGTGDFIVHVVYFASNPADQYKGAAKVIGVAAGPIPAPQATGAAPRYENFNPPAAGPNTLGRGSGEPSIGVGLPITGHPEGRAMFQSDVQTLRVTFNGCAKPLWENKPAPTSQEDFDPILFTDRETGRTFVHLLTFAGNVIAGEQSVTDTAAPFNDGDQWAPSKGSGIGSGIDHQTVGAGRYHAPLPSQKPTGYPNAVYYCSQALADASCARSDDGGINYGPSTVTYSSECGGLHGHVKVAPDGTVYLPNKGCGTNQAAVVSEDNGTTWNIRPVPGSVSASSDPSIGIDTNNRVYFGYADANTRAVITTSTNQGRTWTQPLDVGAALGINNVVFPAVVAGSKDRAAFAFLGTPTAGGLQGPRFNGVWHLYIASTFDGGATWKTVDATPNDPVQRGCIWLAGGANVCRNLLDFMDVQMDQQGRVVVGYADGCAGGECAQAPANAVGNSYTALASIARQSGGPRLLAQFDPPDASTATVPGTPLVTAKRNLGVVQLGWSEADNGGSPITGYQILRGTSSGSEALIATVPGDRLSYVDRAVTDNATTYYYKVVAINAQGASCGDNEVSARYSGNSYTSGGFTVASDPTGDQVGTPDLDIQSLSVAEPGPGPNAGKLVFNLKVAGDPGTAPNERMWLIFWSSPASPSTQFYVGMIKDASGAVSYEYGTVATSTVGLVLGVQAKTKVGTPDVGTFNSSGLITIAVSRNKVGNPQAGDLLGAMTARTYATVKDSPLRSTDAADTTGNATANDATTNATTYAVVGPAPAQLQNLSTRASVLTGDNALIGGFIVTGTEARKLLLRGIGPTLAANGIANPLADPTLELHTTNPNTIIGMNDNWKDTQAADISATGIAPKNDAESAILTTLAPGAYTVIMRGKGDTTGTGVVEIYDLGNFGTGSVVNLSSRGFVNVGDDAMIGGFIVGPPGVSNTNVLVRGLGPSLQQSGISNPLQDPTLELRDANGGLMRSNDNWADTQQAEINATGIPPTNSLESAIYANLAPGAYTAILRGNGSGQGVGLVEIYNVP